MGDDLSRDLTSRMPIVPHSSIGGIDCCGCIIAAVEGTSVELQCNECGAVVGVVQLDILKVLLGLECATATCPHCGKENTFPGFSKVSTYVCAECGEAVGATEPKSDELEWVEIHDNSCTWYEFSDGREPIAVMRCNRCGSHPDIDGDGVVCPLCRKRSPGRSDDLEELILAWNAMIDAGE
jgi:DNA-directed RNA polymerase subunit RPC12/RpoP